MEIRNEEFLAPAGECDLVMKGGITSGVVYPRLILELARDRRFVNIGGTSAGAIAAGLAAAAEYGRADGGFPRLASIPEVLQARLDDLFQPHPLHRKTFRGLLRLLERRRNPLASPWSALRHLPLLRRAMRSWERLELTSFGLCPGTTQRGAGFPALTDWLDRELERVAGRLEDGETPSRPLTFGDLSARGIELRTVATDLSGKSPLLLPFRDRTWMWRPDELAALLPPRVVRWMEERSEPVAGVPGLRNVPDRDDLPVLLAVRASLAFPLLLAALPLYRRDYSLRLDEAAQQEPRRCWLSDGGITSNFPIHLFDDPFPARPTFGIALEPFDPRRHHPDPAEAAGRVWLPDGAGEGMLRAIDTIGGPFGFLTALLDAARNWQDELQMVLPGYRERIVHVALSDEEGGLNLSMPAARIERLGDYGRRAGELLRDFDFAEHRWRRVLAAYAALEEGLESLVESWGDGFADELVAHRPRSYRPAHGDQTRELVARMESLVAVGRAWASAPLRDAWGRSGMPRPRTHLKMVPREQGAGVGQEGASEG